MPFKQLFSLVIISLIFMLPLHGSPSPIKISGNPTDIPKSVKCDGTPHQVKINLEAVEIDGWLKDGVSYNYWTFNRQVPGPFYRACVGDTIEVTLKNDPNSTMEHSVDFHAVTGPGGGSVFTNTAPGEQSSFTFKALKPGLFVYHCATPLVAQHITNGMYGMILIEPEGNLPIVDKEFYVMQGEIYADKPKNKRAEFNYDKMMAEQPEYIVFNGSVDALIKHYPLKAKVGETVRIFFGVGGPNLTSSFHLIGQIFDHVYHQASLTSVPLTNVQTTTVPPGGATIVDIKLEVPGEFTLVDHAIARVEKGLAGKLIVEGPEHPEIFKGKSSSKVVVQH